MIAVALKGLATRKLRSLMAGVRRRPRRRDDRRHLRPDRHHPQRLQRHLQAVDEGTDAIVLRQDRSSRTRTTAHAEHPRVRSSRSGRARGSPRPPAGGLDRLRRAPHRPAGKLDRHPGRASLALGFDADRRASARCGRPAVSCASGPSEVVLDDATARTTSTRSATRFGSPADGATATFTVVGTATVRRRVQHRRRDRRRVRPADRAEARRPGRRLRPDRRRGEAGRRAPRRSSASIAPISRRPRRCSGADQEQKAQIKDVERRLGFINQFLLAFAGIALFVGAFVIFNTLSITVAQRTREFATLRTLGASGNQIARSVLAEAPIGLGSSLVGILRRHRSRQGPQRPVRRARHSTCRRPAWSSPPRTIVVSLAGRHARDRGRQPRAGVGARPASHRHRRCAKAAEPRADVAQPPRAGRGAPRRHRGVGGARYLAAGGHGDRAADPAAGRRPRRLFIGSRLLLPRLVGPLARIVGAPVARFGGEAGRLGRDNAIRNPGRTASTAAALMVGLALMTFVAVLGTRPAPSDRNAARRPDQRDPRRLRRPRIREPHAGDRRAAAAAPGGGRLRRPFSDAPRLPTRTP